MAVSDERMRKSQERSKAAAEGLSIQAWDVPSDLVQRIDRSIDEVLGAHPLRGLFVAEPQPVFLFRIRDEIQYEELKGNPLRLMPWGWPGAFGACFTLSCRFSGSEVSSRVSLRPRDEAAFAALLAGEVKAVFLRGRKPLFGISVDFTASELTAANLREHIEAVRNHKPGYYEDEVVNYWETMNYLGVLRREWNAVDRLQLGWYKSYEENGGAITRWLKDYQKRRPVLKHEGFVPGAVTEFANLAVEESTDGRVILDHIHQKFGSIKGELGKFFSDRLWISKYADYSPEWEELFYLIGEAIFLYNLSRYWLPFALGQCEPTGLLA